ncbi:VUT family protein [Mesorhizobium sp. M4B.F.Ca.ET.143.01.1.1]|uniref:VUT family protein n=1 Tax=Mesorhizobium sp. M4B.F.Ca.ET.143.01.1.1 TaxID=2563947 RepID=UPI001093EBDF|nr:VUT family protein [Mesorhizobium sp. M4B.F.Ca.ET.143.01.1.1]TGV26371.1 VUT family protein [Mesorhizobium sp. M4B.F.Ca.ET.143.01.1.1]
MTKLFVLMATFAATVPAANWLIGHIGTECIPNGPCIIPVGFDLTAPSGVLVIGAAMVLRDVVHEAGGAKAAILAIAIGALLSWFLAPPALVIASVAAFALAELADLAVYAPLRQKGLGVAVLASGIAGAVIDSAVFLWLAFGSLTFIEGQILGKAWMSIAAFAFMAIRNKTAQVQP